MVKILFICKYNRFRSQIAENYFKKINRNKNLKSYSAGIITGEPIPKSVKETAKKLGIKIKGKSKGIKEEFLREIDILVIVANNVPFSLFDGMVKEIIVWKIPDTIDKNYNEIERISKEIMKKVDNLVENLKNKR
jgi:protein-tyrosine-phosphatase